MADVFISYKREEVAWAERVALALEREGFSAFYDAGSDGVRIGETWDKRLEREIVECGAAIVLWSRASIDSDNVRDEARRAHERRILCPAHIETCTPPLGLGTLQTADLEDWRGEHDHPHWRRLIDRGVALKLKPPARIADPRREPCGEPKRRLAPAVEGRLPASPNRGYPTGRVVPNALSANEARGGRGSKQAERGGIAKASQMAGERQPAQIESSQQITKRAGPTPEWALAFFAGMFALLPTLAVVLQFYFSAAARERMRQQRVEHAAFAEVYRGLETQELQIESGETLARILTRAGAAPGEADAATSTVAEVFDPRRIRPGQPVSVYFRRGAETATLVGLAFHSQPGATVTVNRISSGGFAAREVMTPVTYERARILSRVQGSLLQTALQYGATDGVVVQMAEALSYDLDIVRDVHHDDSFEIVFDRYYDDNGDTVRTGELSFVSLTANGRDWKYYRFLAPGERSPEWYDSEGRSARKFLLRAPISRAARLVRDDGRSYSGAYFAAPMGTPVFAAGDGIIQRTDENGDYGNYLQLRHSEQYETAYAHLSSFASGIRPGVSVRQGQVIGYVGSTGVSTEPHLYYQVFERRRPIDPTRLRTASRRHLTGVDLRLFETERVRVDRLREMTRTERLRSGGAL